MPELEFKLNAHTSNKLIRYRSGDGDFSSISSYFDDLGGSALNFKFQGRGFDSHLTIC